MRVPTVTASSAVAPTATPERALCATRLASASRFEPRSVLVERATETPAKPLPAGPPSRPAPTMLASSVVRSESRTSTPWPLLPKTRLPRTSVSLTSSKNRPRRPLPWTRLVRSAVRCARSRTTTPEPALHATVLPSTTAPGARATSMPVPLPAPGPHAAPAAVAAAGVRPAQLYRTTTPAKLPAARMPASAKPSTQSPSTVTFALSTTTPDAPAPAAEPLMRTRGRASVAPVCVSPRIAAGAVIAGSGEATATVSVASVPGISNRMVLASGCAFAARIAARSEPTPASLVLRTTVSPAPPTRAGSDSSPMPPPAPNKLAATTRKSPCARPGMASVLTLSVVPDAVASCSPR